MDIRVSIAVTTGAFNTGFDPINPHRLTSQLRARALAAAMNAAAAVPAEAARSADKRAASSAATAAAAASLQRRNLNLKARFEGGASCYSLKR